MHTVIPANKAHTRSQQGHQMQRRAWTHPQHKALHHPPCAIQDWRRQGSAPLGLPLRHLSLPGEIRRGLHYIYIFIPCWHSICMHFFQQHSFLIGTSWQIKCCTSGLLCQDPWHVAGKTRLGHRQLHWWQLSSIPRVKETRSHPGDE